jgi:hypothetical protein
VQANDEKFFEKFLQKQRRSMAPLLYLAYNQVVI